MLGRRQLKPDSTSGSNQYQHPASLTLGELVAYKRYEKMLPLQADTSRAHQAGSFLSPFRGRGMEFVEARPYQAGDDIRHLDWRLTARIGKPHSKIFQEERERMVFLWVDLHPTMFFATRGAFKSVVGSHLAALIAWNGAKQGHRIGGIITSPTHHTEVRPRQGAKGVLQFFRQLVAHPAWEAATPTTSSVTEETFMRLRRVIKPGSLIFLLSDMRRLTSKNELQLRQLARNNDLVLCHIFDRMEKSLPPAGSYRLTDGQKEMTIHTGKTGFSKRYENAFELRREYLQALSVKQQFHLVSVATDCDLIHTMRSGLRG